MHHSEQAPNHRRLFFRRLFTKLLTAAAALMLLFIGRTLFVAGEFKGINSHFDGKTQVVGGVTGGEDITIDHLKGVAYVSSDDRFGRASGIRTPKGAIYAWDFKDPQASPREMTRQPDDPLAPHGISLVHGSDGLQYLYVVDHFSSDIKKSPAHRILLYRIEASDHLVLVRTFDDSRFVKSPNDVVGVDEHRFYFTNDHGAISSLGRTFEEYLQLKISDVVYVQEGSYRLVAGKIAMANGINMSSDGTQVYVASTLGRKLLVYDRQKESGDLQYRAEIFLNTGVDNIERDQDGNLWIGCHPKLLTFVRHTRDPNRLSPSQVLKLTPSEGGNMEVQEVFLDDGQSISGSSVAAVSGNILLIGPVIDNKLLRCEMTFSK